ncbi:hypothetical protein BGX21_001996, partial [Mortierella sp. AD011]
MAIRINIPDTDQYAQSVELWGQKSGPHRETTQNHSSGASHGSDASCAVAHADMLTEGQEHLQKGDNYRDQGDFDNAVKNYGLAAQFYPNEADERLKLIPLSDRPRERKRDKFIAMLTSSSRKPKSTGPLLPGNDQPRKPTPTGPLSSRNHESLKPISTGPFFPRNNQPHPSILMPQPYDTPKGSVCTFDDAKDTNDIVASFNQADDETKNTLRGQIYDIIAQFKDNLATLETVRELVALARIPDRRIFIQIIEQLLKITKDSSLVPTVALQGLAVATNSCPEGIDM